MKVAYSYSEVRAAEARAIGDGATVQSLMERAGKALADAAERAMLRLGVSDCLFVCGGGNNGGDGFVAARLLLARGYDAAVVCMAETFSPACLAAKQAFGGEIFSVLPRRRYPILLDCLFGTGLKRPAEGKEAALVSFLNDSRGYVIACDVPTGLAEGGKALPPAVRADETVCMGLLKQSLLLSDGADLAGDVSVAELGLAGEGGAMVYEDADISSFFPKRRSNTNKSDYGTAAVMAGGAFSGAAFLSTGACLRSGVGYTKLFVIRRVYPYAIGKYPAAILREFSSIDGEILAADSIAIGMGTGVSERLYVHLNELFTSYTGTLVLDADALNSLAAYGVEILGKRSCRAVVTPHPKEFSRLTGLPVEEILRDPVRHAVEFSKRYGVVVVLKNNCTVIADGDRVAINPTGSPVLAKGGSGDVLSGLLAGTAARGVPPFEAAVCSCYLLGRAGELVAERMGEYAPDASDVIATLADAIRSVGPRQA